MSAAYRERRGLLNGQYPGLLAHASLHAHTTASQGAALLHLSLTRARHTALLHLSLFERPDRGCGATQVAANLSRLGDPTQVGPPPRRRAGGRSPRPRPPGRPTRGAAARPPPTAVAR